MPAENIQSQCHIVSDSLLGWEVAKNLANQNLSVVLSFTEQVNPPDEESYNIQINRQVSKIDSEYVILCIESDTWIKRLKHLEFLSTPRRLLWFSCISMYHKIHELRLENFSNSPRVLYFVDMYGSSYIGDTCPRNKEIHQATSGNVNPEFDTQSIVYPLYYKDVVLAAIRCLFVSQYPNSGMYVSGDSMSYINWLYALRDATQSTISESGSLNPRSDPVKLLIESGVRQQPVTQTTELATGLKETLDLFKSVSSQNQVEVEENPKPDQNLNNFKLRPVVISAPTPPKSSRQPKSQVQPRPKEISLPKPKQLTRPISKPPKPKHLQVEDNQSSWLRVVWASLKGLVIGIVLVALLPFILWGSVLGVWSFRLYQTSQALENTKIQRLPELSEPLRVSSQRLVKVSWYLQPVLRFIPGEKTYLGVYNAALVSRQFALVTPDIAQVIDSYPQAWQLSLSGGSTSDIETNLQLASANVRNIYHQLSLVSHNLNHVRDWVVGYSGVDSSLVQHLEMIIDLIPKADSLTLLVEETGGFLGLDGKQTYLVLLQNNMELRPTGGFIGSFALMTFDQGKMIDLRVEDVYAADGQLRGYVAPPDPIERYLGEASWYLRDSNWDPHFPTAAESATWFLDKELGIQPTGVIGLNLYVIQALLEVMGPVDLPDYDETITADNLYERVQYQTEIDFFPGSTQKRDYLGQLTQVLFSQLKQADQSTQLKVAEIILNQLESGQIMVYTNDQDRQGVLESLGWSGSLQPKQDLCDNQSTCQGNYIAIREANLGVNKANYFIERSVDVFVTIEEEIIAHQLDLNLKNNSVGRVWPGGDYKNYVRFYLPRQVKNIQVSVNDQTYSGQIDRGVEHNKQVVGFLVEVPAGQAAQVSLTYQLGFEVNNLSEYVLYLDKQPGTGSDPVSVTVGYPNFLKPQHQIQGMNSQVGQLLLNTSLDSDLQLPIVFSRNN